MVKQAIRKLYIDTGNLTEWTRLKGQFSQSSKSELQSCIDGTLNTWKESVDIQSIKDTEIVTYRHEQFPSKITDDNLDELEIYAKVFALSGKPDDVDDAVNHVISDLGVAKLHSVIVSLPSTITEFDSNVKDIWQVMENVVDSGKAKEIGVADFDLNQLTQLREWSKIKPATNSVNLATCCVIPPDLIAYSKEHKIRLLTHADARDILDTDYVQTALSGYFTDDNKWQPSWVTRYTVLIKHRGIIKSKGYVLRCDKIEG